MTEIGPESRNIMDLRPSNRYESFLFFEDGFFLEHRIVEAIELLWATSSSGPCSVIVTDLDYNRNLGKLNLGSQDWFEKITKRIKLDREANNLEDLTISTVQITEEENRWSLWKLNTYQVGIIAVNESLDRLMAIPEVRDSFFTTLDVGNWTAGRPELIEELLRQLGGTDVSAVNAFVSKFDALC